MKPRKSDIATGVKQNLLILFGVKKNRIRYKKKDEKLVMLRAWVAALVWTPSLKSRLMALQIGFMHRKEFPTEWRRSTGG